MSEMIPFDPRQGATPTHVASSTHVVAPAHQYHQAAAVGTSSGSGSSSDDSDDDEEEHSDDDDDTEDEKPDMEHIHPSFAAVYPPQQQPTFCPEPPYHAPTLNETFPPRKPAKRSAKEMSVQPEPVKSTVKCDSNDNNRPRQAPVSSANNPIRPQLPTPSAPPVSSVIPTSRSSTPFTENSNGAKARKKCRVAPSAADGTKPAAPTKGRGRSSNAPSLPLSAIHPPMSGEEADLVSSGEVLAPFGSDFTSCLELDETCPHRLRSVVTQLCSRVSRRMRDIDALRATTLEKFAQTEGSPSSGRGGRSENGTEPGTGDATGDGTVSSSDDQSRLDCSTVQLQLTRIAEISERELRIAALQQYCFRLLRNLNICFPAWGTRQGSFLWHSAFILGSVGLRDLAPYCVVFEEVWDDVQIRYSEALRSAAEQKQAAKSVGRESDSASASSELLDIPKPRELNGGLLSSLMFQGDSVTLSSCLIQLDNLRHRVDASFETITDMQDILVAFTAAQTLHAAQQPPVKYVLGSLLKFRSAADLSAGMGRGGKRKTALAALLGGASSAAPPAGRGRAKRPHRATPSIQTNGEAETSTVPAAASEPTAPRGKQVSGGSRSDAYIHSKHPTVTSYSFNQTTSRRPEPSPVTPTTNNDDHRLHMEDDAGDPFPDSVPINSSESRLSPPSQAKKLPEQLSPYEPLEDYWDMSDDNSSSESAHGTAQPDPMNQQPRPVCAPTHLNRSPLSSPIMTTRVSSSYTTPSETSPQRMRPSPLLSASGSPLTPASYLPPNESIYSPQSMQHHAAAMSALASSPRTQNAAPHVANIHLPTHAQTPAAPVSLPAAPSQTQPVTPANGLLPDAFELPRDPDSFRSQVKGVYYDDTSNRWCASWHERKTGKKRSRYFAVKKFGFTQAKTHAMDARLEAEESGECAPTNIN